MVSVLLVLIHILSRGLKRRQQSAALLHVNPIAMLSDASWDGRKERNRTTSGKLIGAITIPDDGLAHAAHKWNRKEFIEAVTLMPCGLWPEMD